MKVYVVLTPTYCGHGDNVILDIFEIDSEAKEYAKEQIDYCVVEEWEVKRFFGG